MENKLEKLLSNIEKIPTEYWEETNSKKYKVVWLLNRQKPSVEQCWNFDEERLGITSDGKIIWAFDSGCSCLSPWSSYDYGDNSYSTSTYKEFFIKLPDFDKEWDKESSEKIDEILSKIK